jgi:hypothetical protein
MQSEQQKTPGLKVRQFYKNNKSIVLTSAIIVLLLTLFATKVAFNSQSANSVNSFQDKEIQGMPVPKLDSATVADEPKGYLD